MHKRLTASLAIATLAFAFAAAPAMACGFGMKQRTTEIKKPMTPVNTAELPKPGASTDESVTTSDVTIIKPKAE